MKQLDRLLFEQGNACFFCSKHLAKAEASVEHLHAVANGGTNAAENVVACCKAVNSLLANKPLKEKFAIILHHQGKFRCPAEAKPQAAPEPAVASIKQQSAPAASPVKLVAAKPVQGPPVARATKSLAPVVPPVVATNGPAQTVVVTCPTCKWPVAAAVGQVDYVCPKCRGAFRY